jgi:hypothetical protein
MTAQTNNVMRSEDVSLRYFVTGNTEIVLEHISFTIKQVATTGSDNVCGQKRGDPFVVTDYFEVDFEGRQRDLSLLADLITNIASHDASTGENPAVLAFGATPIGQALKNFTFNGVTRKPFTMSASGRADLFKMGAGFYCKDFTGPV